MTTNRIMEQEVRAIQEPEFTKSWHPVSHAKVIDNLELAVNMTGMEIVKKNYSLNETGLNMFGTWILSEQSEGAQWMIGFRNSMCKSFAIGICAGTNVMVCSNMMFSGEFIEFRRHTSGVDLEELRILSVKAVTGLTKKMNDLTKWHNSLKQHQLLNNQFKVLTYNAMKRDVIAPSKFNSFINCHEEELKLHTQSLYTFHGACTRLVKEQSLFNISRRTDNLINVCDDYIRLAA